MRYYKNHQRNLKHWKAAGQEKSILTESWMQKFMTEEAKWRNILTQWRKKWNKFTKEIYMNHFEEAFDKKDELRKSFFIDR